MLRGMMTRGSRPYTPVEQIRTLPAYNAGINDIPAFGAVEFLGYDATQKVFQIRQPVTDGRTDVAFNGPLAIPSDGFGSVTMDLPTQCLFDSSGGNTPFKGMACGTIAGSFSLGRTGRGFEILGIAENGRVWVRSANNFVGTRTTIANNNCATGTTFLAWNSIVGGDNQIYDNGGLFTPPNRFTARITGLYSFAAQLYIGSIGDGVQISFGVSLVAGSVGYVLAEQGRVTRGGTDRINVSGHVQMPSGNYLQAFLFHDRPASYSIVSGAGTFAVALLR